MEYLRTEEWAKALRAGVIAGSAAVMSLGGSSCDVDNIRTADTLIESF